IVQRILRICPVEVSGKKCISPEAILKLSFIVKTANLVKAGQFLLLFQVPLLSFPFLVKVQPPDVEFAYKQKLHIPNSCVIIVIIVHHFLHVCKEAKMLKYLIFTIALCIPSNGMVVG